MVGQVVGRYKILEKLGAGGMGEVYRAEDTDLNRQVALKVLPSERAGSQQSLDRFQREAKALGTLSHPNIVTIYSVEKIDGRSLLTMELVEGKPLSDLIPKEGLGLREFFGWAIPLTDALAAAHEQGIIHRDLKPSNIMVSDDGKLKVLDFGLAKLRQKADEPIDTQESTEVLTVEGHVLGTIPYMAPEQVQGLEVDQRSDIFSLGIVLYQMATGHRPFRGANSAELVSAILRDEPDPIDQLKREMPHHLARIIRQCLEKDPEHRLESAKDVGIQLEDLRREITTKELLPSPDVPEPRRRPPHRKGWLATAGAVALAAIAIVLWIIWPPPPPPPPPDPVSPEAQALLQQAELHERRGDTREDFEEAQQRYRRALQLEPGHPVIQARLAALLARIQRQYPAEGQAEEATLLAERALEQDADLPAAHSALGTLALLEGDAEGAMESAHRAQAADPEHYCGHTLEGEALAALGRVDEGLVALRRGVDLAGANQLARVRLARVLSAQGRQSEAAAEYEKILNYDPDLPAALNNLADIYVRTGRQLDAIPLLQRALRLEGDEAAASNLGYIYFNLEQFDKAIEMFEAAHELAPSKPYAPYNIADTYLELGDPTAARQWYETAIENFDAVIAAGGPKAQMVAYRSLCAARLGRFEEARQGVEEALALDPSSAGRLFNAAQVAALTGEEARLYDYMSQALELGFPRQAFRDDAAFSAYRDDPAFLRGLIEGENAP